ncbi:MAG: hypothetical protein O7A63_07470 [Acidobacteria bacterium]|nr:hypothetical protein [Acidobacteriota bacterium]
MVAHFKDGQIRKGFSRDFNPTRESFHLLRREGEIASSEEIQVEELKALFHVKTWGRKDQHRGVVSSFPDDATPPSSGDTLSMIKTVLEFYDGEKIFCYSDDYDPARSGFYALPADPADNNRKIYVVNSSLINIQFYRA